MKLKTPTSDRVEGNPNKIYAISDLEDLSRVFFPQKQAHSLRAGFIAIFIELKNAENQKLQSTDYIADKYNLSQSTLTKARTKMSRLGLIQYRMGYWQFSNRFFRSWEVLKEKWEGFKVPSQSRVQVEKEKFMVEIAKGVK